MKKQILEINRQLEACYIDAKEAQKQLCVLFGVVHSREINANNQIIMKKVLEWYEEFPEPIRSRAIKNYNLQNTIINEESVASKRIAIDHFNWLGTPEGFDYWRSIYDKIEK